MRKLDSRAYLAGLFGWAGLDLLCVMAVLALSGNCIATLDDRTRTASELASALSPRLSFSWVVVEQPQPQPQPQNAEAGAIEREVVGCTHDALAAVSQIGDAVVDYDAIARRTFGSPCPRSLPSCQNHWDDLTPAQQTEATTLIRDLADRSCDKYVAKHAADPSWQVRYVTGDTNGRVALVDIVVEGSSVTKNYYLQFHSFLTTPTKGYPFLVERLRRKIASLSRS